KEPSRFITQLEHEIDRSHPHRSALRPAMPPRPDPTRQVVKSPALVTAVRQHAEKGLSPSALSTFLRCPLDYYYRYLLRVQEPEEPSGSLGSDEVGTVVHA